MAAMVDLAPLAASFRAALDAAARPRFDDDGTLATTIAELRARACAAYPDVLVASELFAAELARRLGPDANPAQLARVRADHVHLAIACAAGDARAIRRFEAEFLDEIDASARRLRARPDQADDHAGRQRAGVRMVAKWRDERVRRAQ